MPRKLAVTEAMDELTNVATAALLGNSVVDDALSVCFLLAASSFNASAASVSAVVYAPTFPAVMLTWPVR